MTPARDEQIPRNAIRAFFAIELGEAARCAVAAVARDLGARPGGRGISWVRPENYHVTLRFLGQVARQSVPALTRHVAQEAREHAPFELGLGAVTGLPSARRPRVVVMDLVPRAPLAALAGAVESGVVAAGFPPESREFRAHMTLGRVRRGAPRLAASPVQERHSFPVRDVVLFRSRLERSGATYDPIERIALGVLDHPTNH